MNDIIRPPRPPRPMPREDLEPKPSPDELQPVNTAVPPVEAMPSQPPKKRSVVKILGFAMIGIALLTVVLAAVVYAWYQDQLKPVASTSTDHVRVVIKAGTGPDGIGELLDTNHLIKSKVAFEWYIRSSGSENSLQAGTYALSQSMSLPEIVEHIKSGKTDTFRITFYPGATLEDQTSKAEDKKLDVSSVLKRAGYSADEITSALKKTYDHPVLKGKPASADLEGYVYGETYEFSASATVEEVLERTFDEMYRVIEENNLETAFKKRGLSLYEGITLASIIQREVPSPEDQKLVAGVFYNRLDQDMALGSDVTYQYIADKTGVERDTNLDSPYNTRRYSGLPPGPISAPGESALIATAKPASTNYLYFLSGDDGKTYFGKTEADHESNIKNHCVQKCKII